MGSIVKGVLDLMCVTIYMVSSLEVFIHAWLLLAPHGLCLKSSWWAFERSGSGHAHRKSWNHSTWGSIAWRKKRWKNLACPFSFAPPLTKPPTTLFPRVFMPGAGKALQTFAGDIGEGAWPAPQWFSVGATFSWKSHGLVILMGMDGWDDVAELADHILICMIVAIFQNREG